MVFLTILLDGLAYGMVLFIISVGLTVTMGLMRVINLAHGAFAMIGGYCGRRAHGVRRVLPGGAYRRRARRRRARRSLRSSRSIAPSTARANCRNR